MSGRLPARLLFALAALLPAAPAGGVELSGEYKNLALTTRDSLDRPGSLDVNRLRLELRHAAPALEWQLTYDHELLAGDLLAAPAYASAAATPSPTWLDAEARISGGSGHEWRHTLHRAWLRLARGDLDATVGRQRIAWGSARFWNPSDRFNPVDPTALEPSEKLGVDALLLQYRYSGFGAIQLVAAPGRSDRNVRRKAALRWRDTVGELDISLTAGRVGKEAIAAADFVGNVADGNLYLEALYSRGGARDYLQLSAGYDYVYISDALPSGLRLVAEYFHNGAASTAPVAADRLTSRVRHLVGLSAGYDLTPLWRLEAMLLLDPVRGSHFALPRLNWSAATNLDLSLFLMLPGGNPGSEFGGRHRLYAAQLQYYF